MANVLQIKRVAAGGPPASLAPGEMAWDLIAAKPNLYVGNAAGTAVVLFEGKAGLSPFEEWKIQTVQPAAVYQDYLDAITGPPGDSIALLQGTGVPTALNDDEVYFRYLAIP